MLPVIWVPLGSQPFMPLALAINLKGNFVQNMFRQRKMLRGC